MTWVVGRAGPFGHAVGISDIRVTLPDGTEHDCLQKIHKIGSQLVLGFAGSVAIGLEAVAQLSRALAVPGGQGAWDPLFAAKQLPKGTRELFRLFPHEQQALGCELILLSAHPTRNDGAAPWAKCYVHRFYSPSFDPVQAQQAEIVSIGSGAGVSPYVEALETLGKDFEMFKFEVGSPGGSGVILMAQLSSLLSRVPQPGISRHLHVCLVGRDDVRLGTNNVEGDGPQHDTIPMPRLARSWQELTTLLQGSSSSAIECATC